MAAQRAQEAARSIAEMNAETERRSRLAKLDQDNRDLQSALLAWHALPNGVRDYAKAVEEATVSSRAAAMARDLGRGDDPATINAIVTSLRQRLDLERQIKEEQDKQALAARIQETATGGLSAYNRELELAARLLAEGRISQAEFFGRGRPDLGTGFRGVPEGRQGRQHRAGERRQGADRGAGEDRLGRDAGQGDARQRDQPGAGRHDLADDGGIAGRGHPRLGRRHGERGPDQCPPSTRPARNRPELGRVLEGRAGRLGELEQGARRQRPDERDRIRQGSKRLKDQIRDMQLQADTLGLSSEAADRLTAQRRLLTAADQDGRKTTNALTAEIDEQADAYAKASEAQRQAQLAQRERKRLAGSTVSLVGSTATAGEARARELAELRRQQAQLGAADPELLQQLREAGLTQGDASVALQRRIGELSNPGLIDGIRESKDAFREFFGELRSGAVDADPSHCRSARPDRRHRHGQAGRPAARRPVRQRGDGRLRERRAWCERQRQGRCPCQRQRWVRESAAQWRRHWAWAATCPPPGGDHGWRHRDDQRRQWGRQPAGLGRQRRGRRVAGLGRTFSATWRRG